MEINYSEIDPAMRDFIKKLNQDGFETISCCQGGYGHPNQLPVVSFKVEFNDRSCIEYRNRLAKYLIQNGITGFNLSIDTGYQSEAIPWKLENYGYSVVLYLWRQTENDEIVNLYNKT